MKTGAILAVAVFLLVGAAAIVPSFIDWSRHKDLVAERLQSMLGRPVTLDGPLSLSLLPTPRFTAEGAAIANLEGASDPSLFKVKRLELRLDLAALIGGRFEASSLVLVKPELSLETLPDGRINWRIEKTARPSGEPGAAAPAAKAPAAQSPSRVESLSIEDGVLTLHSPNRPTIRLDGIRATASADQTAYRGSGRVQLGGTAFAFDLMAGRGIGTETAPLSLALSVPGHRSDIKINGTVAPDWDGFAGKLAAASADLADTAKAIGANPADFPKAEARIDASLSASRTGIAAKGIHVLLADQMADGEAALDLSANPRAEIDLSFKTLDADRLTALAGGHKPAAAPPSAQTVPAPQPATAPDAVPAQPAHPWRGIDADFHLSADLVTYKGSTIRRARFNGQVENGEILIDQASAELPGDADVTFFGFISLASGQPEFEGSFEAAATDLRSFLTWTGIDVGTAAQDRLRALKITGDLRAAADRLALQGVRMTLDSSKAEGSLDLDLGGRPKATLTFEIDSVNADAYRPLFAHDSAPPAPATANAPASSPAPTNTAPRAPWYEGMEATVKGRIGQLVAQGANAKDVVLDGRWDGHAMTLNGFSIADLEGAEIRAKGGISTSPAAFRGLEFAVRTQKPERLAALASVSLPFPAERLGPTVLAGRLDGPLDTLAVNGRAEAAGAVVALSGTVAGLPGTPAVDAAIEASHSSLTQLIRLIRPDYRPRGSLGAFAATVKLTRSADALTLSDLRFKLGPVTAAGDAKIGADNRFEISLTAGEIPIDAFLPATRKAELGPSSRTAAFAPPRLAYTLAATGGMEHPPVSAAPRPKVEQGEITGHWSNDPLDLGILDGLAGTVKLDARALIWSGLRLDGAHLDFALGGGTAKVERMTGQLYGGQFEASGLLSSEGAASVKTTLKQARMQDALPDLAGLDVADGTGDLSMEAETQGRSMAEMVNRLGGRAKLSVTDGRIKGFDLAAMNGKVASNGNAIGLIGGIQAGMNGGSTRFSSFGGTFHAVDGIVTTDDLALVADGGGVKASGAVNLPAYVMDAKADFRLAAANGNTPPLVLRVAGPIDHPRRFIDINAIQAWIARQGGAPADQDDGKSKKIKPKDVLKGLLEGLR